MNKNEILAEALDTAFNKKSLGQAFGGVTIKYDEITLDCISTDVHEMLLRLRDESPFNFDQLIDLCAEDYLLWGIDDWETEEATETGFSRGVERQPPSYRVSAEAPRFGVIYHLLSTTRNQRLRVRVFVHENNMVVPSVHDIWKVADWFEREAYDLYGVLFQGHPDLRRILTDYGFIGHPFRKDFPLSGHVEMRYDAALQKVIYEPVDIEPRILVPKVIRDDNRYQVKQGEKA